MGAPITSRDSKRQHAVDIFIAAYNQRKFTDEAAQRINARGNDLKGGIDALLMRLAAEGRIMSINDKIELIINRGYHTALGLSTADYRSIWPTTVEQPAEYVNRLDGAFLVDHTIKPAALAKCNHDCHLWVPPDDCEDLVSRPVHPVNGKRLTRYVAWIQLTRYLNRKVEDVRLEIPSDEAGLMAAELQHLPGQFERHLRSYAVDGPGSRHGSGSAPCVGWFDGGRPNFDSCGVRDRNPGFGSGSRGIKVVPVSWED
ncbi:MAG: hypothetical protein NUV56_04260 [Candidatus Uhrbacteria bacterium]|nr:hypothetical protein [Candidatus Uhrbacteria bacterium]